VKHKIYLAAILLGASMAKAQQASIPERLGYHEDTKLLIIHADDLGVSHSENTGSIKAMEEGLVNSASIMVPCPWFAEIAAYAREHPEMDFGLHLTLNSEWSYYKWKPVLPYTEVPGLVTDRGFLTANWDTLRERATGDEVERELRAQISRALELGVNITHLDSHMFSVFVKPEYLDAYKKLGREFGIPVLLSRSMVEMQNMDPDVLLNKDDLVVDQLYMAFTNQNEGGLSQFYRDTLRNLKAGLSVILLHAAIDNAEMRAVTIGNADFGSAWRQEDLTFFTSDECRAILEDEQIQLITWKEIKEKLYDKM
jgi:predicted glycoside hydrolase/deacetylase ChbG (UPF0249 family)